MILMRPPFVTRSFQIVLIWIHFADAELERAMISIRIVK